MADRDQGTAGGEADLDVPPPPRPSPPRASRAPRRRARWAAIAAAGAVALVALLAVQHARGGDEAAAGLVAAGGSLDAATRPTSSDDNTRAVLTAVLRNDDASPVTLLALRPTGDSGSLMSDDLRSSGAESMGVEPGMTLPPGREVPVAVSGVVRCPGAGGARATTGDLRARVRDVDGVEREVVVPGPDDRSWTTALGRACAAGPAR